VLKSNMCTVMVFACIYCIQVLVLDIVAYFEIHKEQFQTLYFDMLNGSVWYFL